MQDMPNVKHLSHLFDGLHRMLYRLLVREGRSVAEVVCKTLNNSNNSVTTHGPRYLFSRPAYPPRRIARYPLRPPYRYLS